MDDENQYLAALELVVGLEPVEVNHDEAGYGQSLEPIVEEGS